VEPASGGEVRPGAHGTGTWRAAGRDARLWTALACTATLAAAWWLREPRIPYLALSALATVLSAGAAVGARHGRSAAWAFAVAGALFAGPAVVTQRALARAESSWPGLSAEITRDNSQRLRSALAVEERLLRAAAVEALDAPDDGAATFDALAEAVPAGAVEHGVVLYRAERPAAWAGMVRVRTDTLRAPVGAVFSPLYVVLYATAARGTSRAVATALVHAAPPADTLSFPLDRAIATSRTRGRAFRFAPPAWTDAVPDDSSTVVELGGVPALRVWTDAPVRAEVRLRLTERGRNAGGAALAAMLLCLIAGTWRRAVGLSRRLVALGVALATVAIVPLSAYSNVSRLFDPALFYAPLGHEFTANAGALGLTSTFLLLALLTVLRSGRRIASRPMALVLVAAIAGAGPFLLRNLSRQIAPPSLGVPVTLWLSWQIVLFLSACAVLLAGGAAGRVALGKRRGLPPLLAPAIAAATALLAPVLWQAPGRWPAWYPALWIATIFALSFARRSRWWLLSAAAVAGLGAAPLVWGATARHRVALAERDMQGLSAADPDAARLLERFARDLAMSPPATEPALLEAYATSALAAAEYPAVLRAWPAGSPPSDADTQPVEVWLAPAASYSAGVPAVVDSARRLGLPVLSPVLGDPGVPLVLVVPHGGGRATSVTVFPRTRANADDPFSALLGIPRPSVGDPPYSLTLVPLGPGTPSLWPHPRWQRERNEVHGDWIVRMDGGWARAHAEVDLRSLGALAQRGTLVVLLDMLIVGIFWMIAALADGGLPRWARIRGREWARSFRAQLTVALFTFFVVPATVFGLWSYRRLVIDDRQSRELLVRETLRAAASARARGDAVGEVGERLETPLFSYVDGVLDAASDPLLATVAPAGLFLRPEEMLRLGSGEEVTASRAIDVAGTSALFGFRAARGPRGERLVLGAPARSDEVNLDQRRRDLGFLVLLAAAGGALAALWLSGLAARQLARPVGALRRAALAIAQGEREPDLAGEPPVEFAPVFSAFRRMAGDLSESRSALEEAQRRTAAVLRDVASGVVAVDEHGTIEVANPRADALLECRLRPGTPIVEICPEALVAQVLAFVGGTDEGQEFELELNGRQIRARLTRLRMAGGTPDAPSATEGTVLTLDDLTELSRAQRVLAWGEMARQVAHEIKNPLTPIRLGVQHLRRAYTDGRGNFDEVLERNVGRILEEIDRLDEIARAFSRYGMAPDQRTPATSTDVAAVARDVVALERMGQGEVLWESIDAEAPARALALADELREVLLNILENARLAGARHVRLRVERQPGSVALVTEDDGEGIPDDVMPRIFEPHFSTRTSGSGLGLAISRRMVDGWGGSIRVESERGRGTRVTITLRAEP
jgi:two-component system nitrogen regulation sensor histidine kinase NtrY